MDFIEAGKIVNTHGVRGAVRIEPWTDTPEFLRDVPRIFIDEREYKIINASVHKSQVLATLDGVADLDAANALRGKTVRIAKSDANLEPGAYFIADLLGLDAIDDATGEKFGTVADFFPLPSNDVYVVRGKLPSDAAERDIMIPAVPQFVRELAPEQGCIRFTLIEGL